MVQSSAGGGGASLREARQHINWGSLANTQVTNVQGRCQGVTWKSGDPSGGGARCHQGGRQGAGHTLTLGVMGRQYMT